MEQNHQDQNNQQPKKLLEMHEAEKKPLITDKFKKEVREWVISLTTAVVAVLILRAFIFTIIRVDGPSMSNTLQDGDRLFVNVLDMHLNTPERFDVVILRYPNRNENFVKRVIGMPGETIHVKEGVLYVNGEAVEEEFLAADRIVRYEKASNNFGPIEIPEGHYFVMGDNRDNSNDSRNVGLITEDMFVGTVRYIIWPPERFGEVAGAEVYAE